LQYTGRNRGARTISFSNTNGHSHNLIVTHTSSGNKQIYEMAGNLACKGGGVIETTLGGGHTHELRITSVNFPPYPSNLLFIYLANDRSKFWRDDYWPPFSIRTFSDLSTHTHDVNLPGHNHAIQYGIFEESNSPTINIFINNGTGYGSSIGSYTADQLELLLTTRFTSKGWKAIKFTSDALCRIVATLELKLDITA